MPGRPEGSVSRFAWLLAAALGLLGSILLDACGSSTSPQLISSPVATDSPSAIPTTPILAATTSAASPTPALRGKVLRVVASTQTGPNFNPLYIHATATCPSGTHLLSGGYELTDPPGATRDNTNLVNVPNSYPLDSSSWYAYTSISNPTAGAYFYAYADCLQVSFSVTTVIATGVVRAGPSTTITCPAGFTATGGGWRYTPNGVDASKPSGTGWSVQEPQQVFAVCTNLAYAVGTLASATFPVPSSVTQLTVPHQVACPVGQLVVGGGFLSGAPPLVLKLNKQTISSDGSAWQLSVLNIDSVHTYNATVYAVCLRIRPQP